MGRKAYERGMKVGEQLAREKVLAALDAASQSAAPQQAPKAQRGNLGATGAWRLVVFAAGRRIERDLDVKGGATEVTVE